jgi:RNA polymerase sigma factor (sigma-70 family)
VIRAREDRWFERFRRTGDARLLAQVFDRTAKELGRVATYLCRDRDDAEDAVQGTFLVAIEARHEWDATRPLLPWLLGVLVNRVREQRRRRRQPDAARVRTPADAPDPADVAADGEVGEVVRRALQRLPEPYRDTLERHLVHGQSAAEIAAASGTPAGTVRMRLLRGLDQLRQRLPAGVAGGVAAPALAPESLAAIRRAVLASTPGGTEVAAVGAGAGHFLLHSLGVIVMTKSLQSALAAGLALALAWFLWSPADPTAPALAPTPAPAAGPVASAPSADAREPAAAAGERTDARAIADAAAPRPLPADAQWVDIVVVDGASDAPVADAEVHWINEDSKLRFFESLPSAEHKVISRRPTEAVAARAGWRTRSDADGRARIAIPLGSRMPTTIAARSDGRYGVLDVQPNSLAPASGHRVLLRPDRTIQVRVVDAGGRPVPDVLVTVDAHGSDGARWEHGELLGAYSDADGVATLQHVQHAAAAAARRAAADPGRTTFRLLAAARLPGYEDFGVDVDLAAAASSVELRLPPHGRVSVQVHAAANDVPLDGLGQAWLRDATPATAASASGEASSVRGTQGFWPPTHHAKLDPSGLAHFPIVRLGRQWEVGLGHDDALTLVTAGPTLAGQEIQVALRPDAGKCVVRGRVLAAPGAPLPRTRVRVFALGTEDSDRDVEVATDDSGRFVARMAPLPATAPASTVAVDVQPEHGPLRRATAPDRHLLAGLLDLGDVVVGEMPHLASGRIDVADPRPDWQNKVSVDVWRHAVAPDDPDDPWERAPDCGCRVEADGRITVFGEPVARLHRLRVYLGDGRCSDELTFRPGDSDLYAKFVAAHPVAARALLPAATSNYLVEFALHRIGSATQPPVTAPAIGDSTPADVLWYAVPAGNYELRVLLRGSDAPVLVVSDVQVPTPDDGDPRLRALDLRPLLRTLRVRLSDAAGRPLADQRAQFRLGLAAAPRMDQGVVDTADAFVLPAGPYDGWLCVGANRPLPLRGDADTVDVRVEPWPELEVRVADVPTLPPGVAVAVRVRSAGGSASQGDEDLPGGARQAGSADLMAPPEAWQPLTEGAVRLPVGDEPIAIELALCSTRAEDLVADRRWDTRYDDKWPVWRRGAPAARLTGFLPTTATASHGAVLVTVPAAAWQDALAVLRAKGTDSAGVRPQGSR